MRVVLETTLEKVELEGVALVRAERARRWVVPGLRLRVGPLNPSGEPARRVAEPEQGR